MSQLRHYWPLFYSSLSLLIALRPETLKPMYTLYCQRKHHHHRPSNQFYGIGCTPLQVFPRPHLHPSICFTLVLHEGHTVVYLWVWGNNKKVASLPHHKLKFSQTTFSRIIRVITSTWQTMTSLSLCHANNTIIVIIDCFLKTCRLISLPNNINCVCCVFL